MGTKTSIILLLVLIAAVAGVAACHIDEYCPIHSQSKAIWTGKVEYPDGVAVGEYSCPWGHKFWARCP